MPNIISFMIRSNCPESHKEFLDSYFFSLRKHVEFFQTVTSETILKKEATKQFL